MSALTKIAALAIAAGLIVPVAFAKDSSENASDDGSVTVGTSGSFTVSAKGQDDAEATTASSGPSTVRTNDEENADIGENASDDNATTTGVSEREQHRSEVSAEVQALLLVANRDGGIGAEVRDIARDVASSSEETDTAKEEVQNRPAWMEFLIGSDYKNLGKLRSELSTTQNAINRLTGARDRAKDATAKATLNAQISALSADASTTEAFVSAHESAFSVFGWFFKFFSD